MMGILAGGSVSAARCSVCLKPGKVAGQPPAKLLGFGNYDDEN
jgi:hypothetical protein